MESGKAILEQILKYTNHNVNSLSAVLGKKRSQALYDIESGRTKGISSRLCKKIITTFPEFNQNWVLNGEGEMLKSDTEKIQEKQKHTPRHGFTEEQIDRLIQTNRDLALSNRLISEDNHNLLHIVTVSDQKAKAKAYDSIPLAFQESLIEFGMGKLWESGTQARQILSKMISDTESPHNKKGTQKH